MSYDRYARIVRRVLGVPVALVSFVEPDRQVMPGAAGLPDPVEQTRELPLSHSFCRHVVEDGAPLLAPDVRQVPRLAGNNAIVDFGAVAYAGWPLTDHTGRTVGSLCAVDLRRRDWTEDEVATLRDLAESCSAEIAQRALSEVASASSLAAEQVSEQGRVLLALSEGLAATRTLGEVARAVERVGVDELGCLRAGMWLDERGLGDRAAAGRSSERLRFVPNADSVWTEVMSHADMPTLGANPVADAYRRATQVFLRTASDQERRYPEIQANPRSGDARALLPLVTDGRPTGVLVLTWATAREFSRDERATLGALASYTAQAVQRSRLLQERVEASLTLQRAMLTDLPEPDHLEISARYLPASALENVGGDWYDAVLLPSGCTAITIGDVVGHDIEAAANMSQLRNVLRGLAWAVDDLPSVAVASLDGALAGLGIDALCTMVFARIEQTEAQREAGTRTLRWTNAGHLPPLLVRPDGTAQWLDGLAQDVMLGVDPAQVRVDDAVTIDPGSTVLLCTDGLVERRREDIDAGLDRLAHSATRHRLAPVEQMLDGIMADLLDDQLLDDVAVLAVRFHQA